MIARRTSRAVNESNLAMYQAETAKGTVTLPWSDGPSSGIGSPCSARLSKYNAMASLILCSASSMVSPWGWHPGSAGVR